MKIYFEEDGATLYHGDCCEVLRTLADNSIDAIVTDPPYGLEFMGKDWDAPWKTDRRHGFDGSKFDHRKNPYGGTGVRNGSGQAYGADARMMQALQEWHYEWAQEALRVLKPGGYLLAFGGARTYHRLACAIEDAGFEVRDQILWIYASGFPKSLNVSKAIDKAAGAEREVIGTSDRGAGASPQKLNNHETGDTGVGILDGSGKVFDITAPATDAAKQWDGWGTALKPAHEPIVVARKPLIGTVVANVLMWGTGAVNIDGCRVAAMDSDYERNCSGDRGHDQNANGHTDFLATLTGGKAHDLGRWPANVIHDGSEEVVRLFPFSVCGAANIKRTSGAEQNGNQGPAYGTESRPAGTPMIAYGDRGTAARFFYCAKPSQAERHAGLEEMEGTAVGFSNQAIAEMKRGNLRDGDEIGLNNTKLRKNHHPTVKPLALMRWLVRLVTPPGAVVLDLFAGSGTTLLAAREEKVKVIGIEQKEEYCEIAKQRLESAQPQQELMFEFEPA